MQRVLWLLFLSCLWVGVCGSASAAGATLQVGSKRFTESYILGEIVSQSAQRAGAAAEHRQGLGNTAVV
ncbi:MAG: glycine betaine ABC transporter substrate-binding protein, partial [Rhizobacter sp.]